MTAYTTNLRTALDLIDNQNLPHCWIGAGLGGPTNIDIDVKEDADIDTWAVVLGQVPEINLNNKRTLRGTVQGLALTVTSREDYPTPNDELAEDAATVTT